MTDGGLTIEEALEIFLLRTQSLALTRTLHARLIESLTKVVEAKHRDTKTKHRERVEAFLAACRSYPHKQAEASLFGQAFPKEANQPHFKDAVRELRRHLLEAAYHLHLPWATNTGVADYSPLPTHDQLLHTVRAFDPIKPNAQKTIGDPLLVQAIQRHGWDRKRVEEALIKFGYDAAEAKRYIRTLAKNGAFESVI